MLLVRSTAGRLDCQSSSTTCCPGETSSSSSPAVRIIVVAIRTKGFSFVAEHVDRSRVRAVFDITLVEFKTWIQMMISKKLIFIKFPCFNASYAWYLMQKKLKVEALTRYFEAFARLKQGTLPHSPLDPSLPGKAPVELCLSAGHPFFGISGESQRKGAAVCPILQTGSFLSRDGL